jgi:MoxR-like ATPase
LIVRALAAASGCGFRRIQFTPDLMPADVTGTNVYDAQKHEFRLVRGPVFSDVVLADEINRAPAKTQAALLESMEERNVTIDGVSHPLPEVFTLFATMNPIEYEGTYPLPEAQLDRFLMKIQLAELDEAAERGVVARYASGLDPWNLAGAGIEPLLDPAQVVALRADCARVTVLPEVQAYLVEVVRRTRRHPSVTWGASTRSAVSLLRAARARAACEGRGFVIPDDIKFLAPYVLAHRLVLAPEAMMDGTDGTRAIAEVLDEVPVPRLPEAAAAPLAPTG